MSTPEDWVREVSEFLQVSTRITESWLTQTLDTTLKAADAIADEIEQRVGPTLEDWATDLHKAIEPLETQLDAEAERMAAEITEVMTPIVTPLVASLEVWFEALSTPINNTVDPWVNEHPACIGCRHYYGQAHGGHLLICAMHPYGPEDEKCSDWESVWPPQP
ncbi:hypothetical protein [Leptolyngbya sp. PCC 6406]|uniref:hypothetical protein n=1 Tax=Leptolyngbya sp. PCC 6406 TaxID=1173264 RepID=UPI0002ABB2F9|nr:hypothetical protein [Leptolyngbya sp. PCC 6406]